MPFTLTRRGALTAELPGESATTDRALVVHSDTIGCMVRDLKDNGRLELVPVGGRRLAREFRGQRPAPRQRERHAEVVEDIAD
ncbi:hypothetical protein [Mycobacterium intracellulare]|uniref:hypothetical protein n=1 Tax=Mycobacterium intracellulare TaxID=1767 RepID=UPI001F614DAC|nr:hypothetical protein [Mycobacterium intracellulare]